jgi:hypothetical protein
MKTLSQIIKSQISNSKSQTVRQAVRQAHGLEQSRKTHHPEPGRRANSNDQNSKFQILKKRCTIFLKVERLRMGILTFPFFLQWFWSFGYWCLGFICNLVLVNCDLKSLVLVIWNLKKNGDRT